MKLLLLCTAFLIPAVFANENSGPYELKFEALEQCTDEGTKDFFLNVNYEPEKDTFSGVFSKKMALGDGTEIVIDIEHMDGDEWKKEFHANVGGACSLIRMSPASVQSMLDAMDYKECPIPEGTNTVQNMKNSFQFPFMATAKYGKRRGEMTFVDKQGKRLGCVYMKANVVPAPALEKH